MVAGDTHPPTDADLPPKEPLTTFESSLAGIPSVTWLVIGSVPGAAVVAIVSEFSWFMAIPPAMATCLFVALFAWAWRVRPQARQY